MPRTTELAVSQMHIENRIFTIRGAQVMLDSDLAEMYQTETKFINRAMKRNPDRFPETFTFQLTTEEWRSLESLRFQSGTLNAGRGQHRKFIPFVFTEQGIAMLSAVLQTPVAIKVSVQIMNVFVEMRKLVANHSGLLQRVEGVEQKLLENDQKFDKIFKALDGNVIPTQGVFFDGQVFDAYELASKIIRSAKESIVLIDNFIDESTLTHLAKKEKGVKALLLTKNTSRQVSLDVQKANTQYGDFAIKQFTQSHDRFLIIDRGETVYHIGASLKDLGNKWFAFSKMNKDSVANIVDAVAGLL